MSGNILVTLLCLMAVILSIPAASHTGLATWLSIAAASTAFVAMGLNQFLAVRPRFLESAFGGLDRMYQTHKRLGILAFVLILVHYFVTPNFSGLILTSGLNEVAGTVGEIGFYGLVALIAFSIIKRIPKTKFEFPYHLWRFTHRFIGLFFILIVFHFNFIKRPFDGNAFLAIYLNIFAALGIVGYVYVQIRPFLRKKRYRVTSVVRTPSATVVSAEPIKGSIAAKPGQFAFLAARKSGLGEPHPFTIAKHGGGKGEISFAIKPLGDFTRKLRERIEVGDELLIEGGHGRFNFEKGGPRQVWLAGGIGITPFIAMADALRSRPDIDVHLFHCVREKDEAIEDERLFALAKELKNFHFSLHSSKEDGRLDAKKLVEASAVAPKDCHFFFCGPNIMRQSLVKGLISMKHGPARVEFEQFEFR
ncbi:ferric reductase-like transmembrane domain-containing protein [Rhizobium sp. L1K21]|uniref:ferredoxin reductase family protein n=1 Tax=Rhizobium sp. L1K21 TaxID=2954933 RepID=UPI0020920BB3|nr:ferric reductase-like transmembrane domain-containing protein [Rhizobium sp. L1K21]MCO6184650.1 ferric reductase-like transmembrane domain-containing protein [Rhizobium sp. L1K21]